MHDHYMKPIAYRCSVCGYKGRKPKCLAHSEHKKKGHIFSFVRNTPHEVHPFVKLGKTGILKVKENKY